MLYLVAAADPGEAWCGLAVAYLATDVVADDQAAKMEPLMQSRRRRIRVMEAETLTPQQLYDKLERLSGQLYHLVLERYSLYPWMAREQGYSELLTAQCVGVVKYIAGKAGVPVTLQDAKGCLRGGRAAAKKAGFPMEDRALGSGRFRYRGPDFALPGRPHRRDALAHLVWWATHDQNSPLLTERQLPR